MVTSSLSRSIVSLLVCWLAQPNELSAVRCARRAEMSNMCDNAKRILNYHQSVFAKLAKEKMDTERKRERAAQQVSCDKLRMDKLSKPKDAGIS